MPSLSRDIPKDSDLHKKLLPRLVSRIKMAEQGNGLMHDTWRKDEEKMLAYLPETEEDALRRSRRERGQPHYTTIQVPYTYAVVMAIHTYLTSVFFARNPVHQFAGRHGAGEMQTQAVEAMIAYQVEVGEMMAPYYLWMYDGIKYGAGILGTYWDRDVIYYTSITEQLVEGSDKPVKMQTTQGIQGYQGNKAYNVSPYNFLHDPRVPLGLFQKGEFCIVKKMVSWNDVVKRRKQGFYIEGNLDSLTDDVRFASPNTQGSDQLVLPQKMLLDCEDERKHPATLDLYEMYIEIIPKEWMLSSSDYPEKWVFTISGDQAVILGATPLGLAHGKFPFDVIETEVEAYGLYNRSTPSIIEPIQNTLDWLLNSHFYNVRAALNNQFIFDPSKVYIKDIQSSEPGLAIRLRPEAYGTPVDQVFKQLQVGDVTRGHVTDIQQVLGLGERVLGVNEQMLGVLATGGRKTATEVRTSTGFGVNRLKTVAEYISAGPFSQHAQKLVAQSQQYYSGEQKLRMVGDLAGMAGPQFLSITPELIAGAFDFVPVDGTLPIDRMAQATLWKEIFAGLRYTPEVAMTYDIGKMFAWVAQLGGLKNINQFKIQVMPDQQLQAAAAAGNVVPMQAPAQAQPRTGQRPVSTKQGPQGGVAANAAGMNGY